MIVSRYTGKRNGYTDLLYDEIRSNYEVPDAEIKLIG